MFLSTLKNHIMTLAIDTNGLQGLVDEISSTLDIVLGVLIGLVGLAAVCVSVIFLIKAGFTSDAEKRSKNIKAIMWLWGIVLAIAILWGLKAAIIAIDEGIKGYKQIKLTNTTSKVESFDLSEIYIPRLTFQLTNKADIYNEINNHIDKYLGEFSFYQEGHLNIYHLLSDNSKLNWNSDEFLRMLVAKNPPLWTIKLTLTIDSDLENVISSINFNVVNSSGSTPFDPDADDSWNPGIGDKNQNTTNAASIIGSVFGSIAVIGIVVAIILGLKLHYRNNSKKIK